MSAASASADAAAVLVTLKTQIEYYFSPANLRADAYLNSLMDADHYVPIAAIAGFRKVQALTLDIASVTAAMHDSKFLEVDASGSRVRARTPLRLTVIIRKIPGSTPEAKIRALFAAKPELAAKITTVKSSIEDTWFVTFADEASCAAAAAYLPTQSFNDAAVACTIKSETANKSFYAARPNASAPAWVPGFGFTVGVPAAQGINAHSDAFVPNHAKASAAGYPGTAQGTQQGFSAANGRHAGKTSAGRNAGNAKGANGRSNGSGRNGSDNAAAANKDLSRDFPTLDGSAAAIGGAAGASKGLPPVRAGYAGPFRAFSREQMAAIVQSLIAAPLPAPPGFPSATAASAQTVGVSLAPSTEVHPEHIRSVPILRKRPATSCTILDPIPVMFPASPSPAVMPTPGAAGMPPHLDLSAPNGAGGLPGLPTLGAAGAGALPSLANITDVMASMSFSAPPIALVGGLPLPLMASSSSAATGGKRPRASLSGSVGGKPLGAAAAGVKPTVGAVGKKGPGATGSGPTGWAAVAAAAPTPAALAAAELQQKALLARKAAAAAATAAAKQASQPDAEAAAASEKREAGAKGPRRAPGQQAGGERAPRGDGEKPRGRAPHHAAGAAAGAATGPYKGGRAPGTGPNNRKPAGLKADSKDSAASAPAAPAAPAASRWADLLKGE